MYVKCVGGGNLTCVVGTIIEIQVGWQGLDTWHMKAQVDQEPKTWQPEV